MQCRVTLFIPSLSQFHGQSLNPSAQCKRIMITVATTAAAPRRATPRHQVESSRYLLINQLYDNSFIYLTVQCHVTLFILSLTQFCEQSLKPSAQSKRIMITVATTAAAPRRTTPVIRLKVLATCWLINSINSFVHLTVQCHVTLFIPLSSNSMVKV